MDKNEIKKRAEKYLSGETNNRFRQEVKKMLEEENFDELSDRFYTSLDFGTGGLRGVIGGGTNRMNTLVIRQATQGLANYINAHGETEVLSAVIAFDSRRYSDVFAKEAALVLCANGIKTFLFSALRPTPELSFAVRRLSATAGIVITASHNPPEYNGYKVYWSDGAQIVAPHDTGIIEEVNAVGDEIKSLDEEAAQRQKLLQIIDTEVDDAFIERTKSISLRPELLKNSGKDLTMVYTPLHGTGAMMVERVLGDLGIRVITVPEQREPDGEFPTVEFPNPEEGEALSMAIELGKKESADIVVGTDPDADRIGIAVPEGKEFRLITGNQLGALLADYIFGTRSEQDSLPEKPAFIKTVVTTELQRMIVEKYGGLVFNTLTGFKHIAAKIRAFDEEENGPVFIFGGEESYGYMVGDAVRDKDSIASCLMTVEMTLYLRSQGKTVIDRLNELYREFGYYEEIQISKYFRGAEGQKTMDSLMKKLREAPPEKIGRQKVLFIKDYLEKSTTNVETGVVKHNIDLPKSNVLQFLLHDTSIVSVRPSGTEPKIKFYASCPSRSGLELDEARNSVRSKLSAIRDDINEMIPD